MELTQLTRRMRSFIRGGGGSVRIKSTQDHHDDAHEHLGGPTSPRVDAQRLAALLAAALALHGALFGGGIALVGTSYTDVDAEFDTPSVLGGANVFGVGLWICGVAFCPLITGLLLVRLGRLRSAWAAPTQLRPLAARLLAAALAAAISAACAGFAAYCWLSLVRADQTFNIAAPPDALHQFLGGMAFAMYVPVSLLAVAVAVMLAMPSSRPAKTSAGDSGLGDDDTGASALLSETRKGGTDAYAPTPPSSAFAAAAGGRPHQPDGALAALPGVASLLVLLAAVGMASCLLTCIWNFSAQSYFTSQAYDSTNDIQYSLVPGLVWKLGPMPSSPGFLQAVINVKVYLDVVVYFTVLGGTIVLGFAALLRPALRRRLHMRLGQALLPRPLLLAHLDSCARTDADYAAEEAARRESHLQSPQPSALWVHLTASLPPTGAAAVRRLGSVPRELLAQARELSVGETLVLGEVAMLYAFWLWYWLKGYQRIVIEVEALGDKHEQMHVWARVLGHMTTLTMSFLAFPVARNSVWESAFGMPFERAVAYHRALGRLTWALVTAHMLLWQAKWLLEGTLLSNMTTVRRLEVTPCEDGPQGLPCASPLPGGGVLLQGSFHVDNFTVVAAELAWLLLTCALVIAQCCRRSNYELFHITHHAVLVFFLVALLHAWSHWYYTAAGLVLYVFDKAARAFKAARPVEVVSISYAAGVTRLVLGAGCIGASGFYAGQYAFLCVPALAGLEWHPFTLSGSPEDALLPEGGGAAQGEASLNSGGGGAGGGGAGGGTVSFHVKDMGPGTWTRRLARMAVSIADGGAEAAAEAAARLSVSVDGPYGRSGLYHERSCLLLVAGGIGLTPFHALLLDLQARMLRPAAYGALGGVRRVRLVWVVRELDLVHAFAATLLPLVSGAAPRGGSGMFDVSIYCTHRPRAREPEPEIELEDADEDEAAEGAGPAPEQPLPVIGAVEAGWADEGTAATLTAMVQPGRPNLSLLFREEADEARRRCEVGRDESLFEHVTAMVCGPQHLADEVARLSLECGFDFHSEVFHF